MNIKDLDYFVRLTEVQHFSRVAKEFNVSQPTITFAVKRLEREMGSELLSRHHTSALKLTAEGNQFLKHAKAILNHWQISKREIEEIKESKVIIGLPPLIENNYFTFIAKRLKQAGLLKRIRTHEEGSATTLTMLKNGEVDIALLGLIAPLSQDEVINEVFDHQTFRVYVSKDNPLAKKSSISFADLKDHDFIQFKKGFVHNYAFDLLSKRLGIEPNVIFRSDELSTIINLIATNIGIGFFTSIIPIKHRDIVSLPLSDQDAPTFNVSLAYRKSHYFDDFQVQVMNCIRDGIDDFRKFTKIDIPKNVNDNNNNSI